MKPGADLGRPAGGGGAPCQRYCTSLFQASHSQVLWLFSCSSLSASLDDWAALVSGGRGRSPAVSQLQLSDMGLKGALLAAITTCPPHGCRPTHWHGADAPGNKAESEMAHSSIQCRTTACCHRNQARIGAVCQTTKYSLSHPSESWSHDQHRLLDLLCTATLTPLW